MSHPDQTPTTTPTPTIDWIKTAAGALAAVTAAVILSTLGAAGTLLGAAIGSVAATVGSALYAQGLAKSKQTVLKAQESALVNLGVSSAAVHRARNQVAERDEDVAALTDAESAADAPHHSAQPTRPSRLGALPWMRISLLAAATFVAAMVVITGFETLSGRSVSAYTGGSSSSQGSTLGGVTETSGHGPGSGDSGNRGGSSASPSASATSSASPSASPSSTSSATSAPSASASSTASSSPSSSASSTASASPSTTQIPTPTSSAPPTAR